MVKVTIIKSSTPPIGNDNIRWVDTHTLPYVEYEWTPNGWTGTGGGGGTTDYNDLSNKPSIAGVSLEGNKSLADLGIQPAGAISGPNISGYNSGTGTSILLGNTSGTYGYFPISGFGSLLSYVDGSIISGIWGVAIGGGFGLSGTTDVTPYVIGSQLTGIQGSRITGIEGSNVSFNARGDVSEGNVLVGSGAGTAGWTGINSLGYAISSYIQGSMISNIDGYNISSYGVRGSFIDMGTMQYWGSQIVGYPLLTSTYYPAYYIAVSSGSNLYTFGVEDFGQWISSYLKGSLIHP